MAVCLIGFHYPQPALLDDLVARVQRVAEAFQSSPGCLSAQCFVTLEREAVVSIVTWESETARDSSMQAVLRADIDVTFDEREVRPRALYNLTSASRM